MLAADRTVTFAALKPGLCLAPEPDLAGELEVVDIGLDPNRGRAPPRTSSQRRRRRAVVAAARAPTRTSGHARCAIIAGSPGMTGAAALAAAAAQRAGAGMVQLSTPGRRRPRAPARRSSAATAGDGLGAGGAARLERFHAVVIGPGLGREPTTVAAERAT